MLRYAALRSLAFPSLSTKRAALLAAASVAGEALPGVAEGNAREATQVRGRGTVGRCGGDGGGQGLTYR